MKDLSQVMPPLSPEEYAALKADIFANGVQVPVDVDENDNILDGFHRWQICEELGIECPKRVLTGLTEAQKREHAYRMNLDRRHLSKAQKVEIAGKLWLEGWTQDAIAKDLGCSQPTASRRIDQFMQTHKLPQPVPPRRGKDGKAYPAIRAPKSAKRQPEGTNTDERGSTSPTPTGNSIDISTDAELAERMQQQDAMPASHVEPERPLSGDVSVVPTATDPSDAAPPGNSTTPAVESETPASLSGSLPAQGIDNTDEQSLVKTLEALLAQVQVLQVQGGLPRLSAHWPPETRTRCLDIIRCLKELFTKWEGMLTPEVREAESADSNEDSNNSASDVQSLPSDHLRHALGEVLPAIGTGQAACRASTAQPVAGASESRMQDHLGSDSLSTDGGNAPVDLTGSPDKECPIKKPAKQILMDF